VGQGISLEDRDSVSDTFSAFSDQSTSFTCGEQRQDCRVDQGERLYLEMFEHELSDLALVFLVVEGSVSHQNIHVAWFQAEFFGKHLF